MFDPHTLAVRIFNLRHASRPISSTAFELLTKVHAADGIAQQALGRSMRISPPNLTRLLARLGRAGLVRQVPSPTDRRRRFVRLTPLGRHRIDGVQEMLVMWQTE